MTEAEFQRLSTIYGANVARWPEQVQESAERWRASHPEAGAVLREAAVLDHMLSRAAPVVDAPRVDALVDALRARTGAAPLPWSVPVPFWRRPWTDLKGALWRWTPEGAVYVGLFVLGCAANTAVRLLTAETPLEAWLAANLSLSLGG
ncbi:MAG: hypothetical protein F8N37_17535 [Telmatospirillum sp.]|nr:hypothetical protein [Telmatospirillum sp.]